MNSESSRRSFFARFLTKRHLLTMSIGLVVILGWALSSQRGKKRQLPPERRTATPVSVRTTSAVRVREFHKRRLYTGEIKAARSSEIGFERTGRLISVLVGEGDRVAAGQELAHLDKANLLAQQRELRARRDAAVSLLDELVAGPRPQTIAAAEAEVRDLQAQVELAKQNVRRRRQLVKTRAISLEEFDEFTIGQKSATARLDAAMRRLEELKVGTRLERVRAQKAVVAQFDANLQNIAVDIKESTLRAPFAGVISKRHVDEGTIVAPGAAILRIVEDTKLEAWIGIPPELAGEPPGRLKPSGTSEWSGHPSRR